MTRIVAPLERALEEQIRLAARTEELLQEELAEERGRLKEAELRVTQLEAQLESLTRDRGVTPEGDGERRQQETHERAQRKPAPEETWELSPSETAQAEATVRIIDPRDADPEPSLPPYEPNLTPPPRARERRDQADAQEKGPLSLLRRLRESS